MPEGPLRHDTSSLAHLAFYHMSYKKQPFWVCPGLLAASNNRDREFGFRKPFFISFMIRFLGHQWSVAWEAEETLRSQNPCHLQETRDGERDERRRRQTDEQIS